MSSAARPGRGKTLRSRFSNTLRAITTTLVITLVFLALITSQLAYGWVFVLIVGAVIAAVVWIYADEIARRLVADHDNLLNAIIMFNNGVRSARSRATGSREMRQLADGFNRMAADAEAAHEELHQEEKRKMQFVSDVSHELRTPLTAIRGAAETLLEGGVDEYDTSRFLTTIAMESERLTRLANDLLTLQRIEGATGELPLRRFNLREAIARASAMLEPLIEVRGVKFWVTGEAPDVLGDIDRIQQVVANLVDNASRMVGDGGKVWVELSSIMRTELASHIPAKSFVDIDRFAVMAICDNGPGIPEAEIGHLFERFYRTDHSRARDRGGSGLGLSIVRAIIVSHNGSIEAENRIGGGTQFTVYLPVVPDAPTSQAFRQ